MLSFQILGRKRKRCGHCPACTREDCGACQYCLDMPKFGGPGNKKQRCKQRRCQHVSTSITLLNNLPAVFIWFIALELQRPNKPAFKSSTWKNREIKDDIILSSKWSQLDTEKRDGNCLFWALSKQLNGDSERHKQLRNIITEFVASNTTLFRGWTVGNMSIEDHLTNMRKLNKWGSHLEIKAAATLFQRSIYVATDSLMVGRCKWTVFNPFPAEQCNRGTHSDAAKQFATQPKRWLEISNTDCCHYDSIMPIHTEKPITPPFILT